MDTKSEDGLNGTCSQLKGMQKTVSRTHLLETQFAQFVKSKMSYRSHRKQITKQRQNQRANRTATTGTNEVTDLLSIATVVA